MTPGSEAKSFFPQSLASMCFSSPCPHMPQGQYSMDSHRHCHIGTLHHSWGTLSLGNPPFYSKQKAGLLFDLKRDIVSLSRLLTAGITWEMAWVKSSSGPVTWVGPAQHVGLLEMRGGPSNIIPLYVDIVCVLTCVTLF